MGVAATFPPIRSVVRNGFRNPKWVVMVTFVHPEEKASAPEPAFLAYLDSLSAIPGEDVELHVSTTFDSFDAQLVRILRGGPRPVGEPDEFAYEAVGEPQRCPGDRYDLPGGSGAIAKVRHDRALTLTRAVTFAAVVWPTRLGSTVRQTIMSARATDGRVLSLAVEQGRVSLQIRTLDGVAVAVTTEMPVAERRWYVVAGVCDLVTGRIAVMRRPLAPYGSELVDDLATAHTKAGSEFNIELFALGCEPDASVETRVRSSFNGKVSRPTVFDGALDLDHVAHALRVESFDGEYLARWILQVEMGTRLVRDDGPLKLDASTVNSPQRAVTGPHWTGEITDFRLDDSDYDAIYFHDDDLDDCRWPTAATVAIPEGSPSGCYAVRLSAGGTEDFVPLIVTAAIGSARNRIAFLASTYTYLAYANFETSGAPVEEFTGTNTRDVIDPWVTANPDVGLSLYNAHSDGSGIHHSTCLRPLLTLRPNYRWWMTGGAGWSFAGDLYVIDWLAARSFDYDVISDHELHRSGVDLLSQYDVVITGLHPEYYSSQMLDAIEQYTHSGNLMYLGGNGFYWVITVPEDRAHLIELRRGNAGTRTWEDGPGENHHSTTGEPGGLWRHRGRAPQGIVGVGFSAEGGGGSAGYVRLPDSHREDAAFIFEGVGPEEIIGDFGIHGGGAAGSEIDRADTALGTPPDAWLLATSSLRQNDFYLRAVEEILYTIPDIAGSNDPNVRADMVFFRTAGGGAVFTPGSIDWPASLSHNNYVNNVSRITENVLRHFTRP